MEEDEDASGDDEAGGDDDDDNEDPRLTDNMTTQDCVRKVSICVMVHVYEMFVYVYLFTYTMLYLVDVGPLYQLIGDVIIDFIKWKPQPFQSSLCCDV